MLIIIIFAVLMFIWGYSQYGFFFDGLLYSIAGLFVGFIFYFFIGGIIGVNLPLNEICEEQKIYALNDSSSIEGQNYLFSGYVDEELVYRYVIDTDKGKYIEEIDAYNAYINEGNYNPMVKHYSYEFEKKWHKLFAHTLFVSDYYEFYVPENTITTEYNVDLN